VPVPLDFTTIKTWRCVPTKILEVLIKPLKTFLSPCLGMNASGFTVVGVNVIGLAFAMIHAFIVGTAHHPSYRALKCQGKLGIS